jgi:hypothetical protein
MKLQATKCHLRAMSDDQKIMLGALMSNKGCKRNGYVWNDKSIFAYDECDYYMYIDSGLNIKFGYGDRVFINSPFTDNTSLQFKG